MIKIITIGKLKEKYLKDAFADYKKRISKYHKIELIELPDTNTTKEKEEIKKHISSKEYIVTMEIEGKELSSPELSRLIDKTFINYPCITFIIGSSEGLHDEIKSLSNYKLSFSKLTFPHGLFRLILLEQIYRSFKILNGETYHK